MEKEENLNQDDNTKQSTEDNSNTEKQLKEDQANINKDLIPTIASYYDMMIDRIEILKTSNNENWDAIFRSTSK